MDWRKLEKPIEEEDHWLFVLPFENEYHMAGQLEIGNGFCSWDGGTYLEAIKDGEWGGASPHLTLGWLCIGDLDADSIQVVDILPAAIFCIDIHDASLIR